MRPPPKRHDPANRIRGAGYSSRACDGSITQLYSIGSIKATEGPVNGVTSLLNRSVVSTQNSISAPTR